jgi:putative oxidoreductase
MTDEAVDRKRLLIPALAPLYEAVTPLGYSFMRAVFGIMLMMPHGYEKIVQGKLPVQRMIDLHLPYPTLFAYWIGSLEFFGGALLALGLFTRLIAAMFTVEMAVISFLVLWPVYGFSSKGYEYALMMGLFALGFACGGGGRYSLDRLIGREL